MIFFFFILVLAIKHEAVFANSTEICDKCACNTDDAQILNIDCRNVGLDHVWGEWPEHNKTIIVTYAGNSITTLDPLPQTDASVEIVLSKCNISSLQPKLLTNVVNVKFVDLSYNKLTADELSSDKFQGPSCNKTFDEPIALENLNLAYNQIHSLSKNLFKNMPKLKRLNLEGNNLKFLDIHTQSALSSITTLQGLNLANNSLTELIKDAMQNFTDLTELDLSKNALDFVPSSLALVGGSLEVLILDDNPILEFYNETFLGLKNLQVLSANHLKMKYVNANTFAPLAKLRKLSLSNNDLLRDIDREAFAINQTLEEFYINNNNLFHIDYKLLPWAKLHVMEFQNNSLHCSCSLYNITKDLPRDVTRREDGPYCKDPRNDRPKLVYHLNGDLCTIEIQSSLRRRYYVDRHFSTIRLSMIILSVVIILVAILALILASVRYMKFMRNRNYPFASQVLYNPLSTHQ